MKLSKLLKSIEVVEDFEKKDIEVKGIAYDSRKVEPGYLFICIKGYKTDGHNYIFQAIENGAIGIIVEEIDSKYNIPQYKVKDSRKALSGLSAAFYNNPSKDIKTIGITGTNGKTSTSFMVNSILEKHGLKTGLIGTVMIKYNNYSSPSILTTPESLDLQRLLNDMRREKVSYITMEVSSSALELNRVDNIDYDIVSLNNISREHIDLHGSFEEYFKIKSSLIKNMKSDGWAILNLDCPYSASLIDKTKANVLTYGIKNKGILSIKNLDLSTGRGKFILSLNKKLKIGETIYNPQSFKIELSVPGLHSVYNSLVAIAIGLLSEIPINTIQSGINSFKGVERRFQFIYDSDFKIIDDHFANVGNINTTMETLSLMKYNDFHLVYAIRGSRGVITNRENAETIAKWLKRLGKNEIIVTKSLSHTTNKDKVLDEEVMAFTEVMDREKIKFYLYDELHPAIEHVQSLASKGDIVLLAGCQGMDYGAKIILENIYKLRPNLNKEKLFKPLTNRVAGIA